MVCPAAHRRVFELTNAGPAKIAHGRLDTKGLLPRQVGQHVDLLVREPARFALPQLVRHGVNRQSERVAVAAADNAPLQRRRIHADDLAGERPRVLRASGTEVSRRVLADVWKLANVGRLVRRAVAGGKVDRPVSPGRRRRGAMRGELAAEQRHPAAKPVVHHVVAVDDDLLGPHHSVGIGVIRHAREAAVHQAAVDLRRGPAVEAAKVRARVANARRFHRVGQIDETGRVGHPEQPVVGVVGHAVDHVQDYLGLRPARRAAVCARGGA